MALLLVLGVGNLDSARQQLGRLDDAVAGRTVAPFDWWGVSRLNPGTIDIDEFPAWTVLFGDPHPHLLWAPVLLALVATLVAYVATRRAGDRRAATALAAIVGTGLAWSRQPHVGPPDPRRARPRRRRGRAAADRDDRPWRRSLGHLALIGGLTVVVAHPYVAHGQVFDSGFAPSPARTPLGSFLLQLGLPLAIVVVAAERRARRRSGRGLPGVLASRRGRAGVARWRSAPSSCSPWPAGRCWPSGPPWRRSPWRSRWPTCGRAASGSPPHGRSPPPAPGSPSCPRSSSWSTTSGG
ncbi:MAG: DUF2298 domain-containing protein [Acidimicrobiales bacterium]